MFKVFLSLFLCLSTLYAVEVRPGLDCFFKAEGGAAKLKGKRVGLITNHTAVSRSLDWSVDVFRQNEKQFGYSLVALFAPEHGIQGRHYAEEHVADTHAFGGIPVFSLHGKTRRPTSRMLKNIDILVYDIQDIGCRSYTYVSTLFYAMEEAAKHGIEVVVLDRPNPINGVTMDGPMLEDKWRSYVGYVNVPYIHGMTVGELAKFFNREYGIKVKLTVIPMEGWQRTMSFPETGLAWIPTSPQIPENDSPLFYPMTGILGELQLVNIGVGYTLPFKVVGAPWIDADKFADELNKQKFPGVVFHPFHFRPFFGRFKKEECQGVLIRVSDATIFEPVATQYLLIGILKSLYPKRFVEAFKNSKHRKAMFCKVNGTEKVYTMIEKEQYIVWKLRNLDKKKRAAFRKKREKYLLYR